MGQRSLRASGGRGCSEARNLDVWQQPDRAPAPTLARARPLRHHSGRTPQSAGMIREPTLLGPHRRPTGPAVAAPPGPAATPPARPRLVALNSAASAGGVESLVIARVLNGEGARSALLDTLATLTAGALQEAPNAWTGATPAELRGVAARIATGLAVALLESDLAERIASRLAQEAPFAEGWRSCPE